MSMTFIFRPLVASEVWRWSRISSLEVRSPFEYSIRIPALSFALPRTQRNSHKAKGLRMAGGMCAKSRVSQRIKLAGLHIGLELTIPGRSVKRRIPSAKCRKFLGGKLLNLLFDPFDVAHASP